MTEKHVFRPFKCTFDLTRCKRIDLEIYGIDHFRPSYTGLIFINDSRVDAKTAMEDRPGFAGRFSVFAHEICYGDEGHCSIRQPRRFDTRRSSPLTKAFKRITVTESIRRALADSDTLMITLIVIDTKGDRKSRKGRKPVNARSVYEKLFSCEGLQLVAYA